MDYNISSMSVPTDIKIPSEKKFPNPWKTEIDQNEIHQNKTK